MNEKLSKEQLIESGALLSKSAAAVLCGVTERAISAAIERGAFPEPARLYARGSKLEPSWEVEQVLAWNESGRGDRRRKS